MFDIKQALKSLPDKPGVYIMKNQNNEIIYIGKAISLKNRVRQYFGDSKNQSLKVLKMVQSVQSFEYITTDNEIEALVLECNMIKQYRPKYNILLKDDKHYPYIKITLNEDFPRLIITRKILKDGARYFGPYTNRGALNATIETIKNIFPIRTCKKKVDEKSNFRPCLNFHIKRCLGPCTGNISKEVYKITIMEIIDLLKGNHAQLEQRLIKEMEECSQKLMFEKAGLIRDKINSIKIITEKQKVFSKDLKDRDIIGYASNDNQMCVEVFFVRGGKLIGKQSYFIDISINQIEEAFKSFVEQYYINNPFIPPEILIMNGIEHQELIEIFLEKKLKKKVSIICPQRGEKHQLMKMVVSNAELMLKNKQEDTNKEIALSNKTLMELGQILKIQNPITTIEAFDISNTANNDIVAGKVVFKNGLPYKDGYRKYKIKTVAIQDDYSSMREVLKRRFKKLEDNHSEEIPDLILIDGGRKHVDVAKKTMSEFDFDIPIFGMQKDYRHKLVAIVSDNIHYDISLNKDVMHLLVDISNEVHRFTLYYNKLLRKKRYITSELDSIQGIGSTRKKILFESFGSLEKIQNATVQELEAIDGIDKKTAKSIYQFFRGR
jgi:excinuclease ABC subunit C